DCFPLHRTWHCWPGRRRGGYWHGRFDQPDRAGHLAILRSELNRRKRRCRREAGIAATLVHELRGFLPLTERGESILLRAQRYRLLRFGEIPGHVLCPKLQRGRLHRAAVAEGQRPRMRTDLV